MARRRLSRTIKSDSSAPGYVLSLSGGAAVMRHKELGPIADRIAQIARREETPLLFVRSTWNNSVVGLRVVGAGNVEVRDQPVDQIWLQGLYDELKKRGIIPTVPRGGTTK